MNLGLDIIIVNYFSKPRVNNLLNSIIQSDFAGVNISVIIVNNSPEEVLDFINFEKLNIQILTNQTNMGFGYACNQAIPLLKNEYVLLLNPDILVFENTLVSSLLYLDKKPEITIMGIKHYNESGIVASSCSRFPSLRSFIFDSVLLSKLFPKTFYPLFLQKDWNHLDSRFVDQVMGAYLIIRKSFIDKYGLFDARYFVFLEDLDLCKNVWDKGGKVFYNADISLLHIGASSTTGVIEKKICYLMESKIKYCKKHFIKWKYYVALFVISIVEPLTRLFFSVLVKPHNIKNVVKAYKIFYSKNLISMING